jgi:hypothetical protein
MAGINSSAALPPHMFGDSADLTLLQRRRQARVRVFRGRLCRTYLHLALSRRAAPCRGNGSGSSVSVSVSAEAAHPSGGVGVFMT